jgi:hypothetical protein
LSALRHSQDLALQNQSLQYQQYIDQITQDKQKFEKLALCYRDKKKKESAIYKEELLKMFDLVHRYSNILSEMGSTNGKITFKTK